MTHFCHCMTGKITPLQISLAYIVKMILGFKNAYGMDEELRKAHQAIIQWLRILGFVAGEIVACDSSKIRVDGLTYEGAEEVFDYQTKENVRGYKLFVIYDEENFLWLGDKEHTEYVSRGKEGTKLYEQVAELDESEFREVILKTKEYEPKTARGKAAQEMRDEEKKPVRIAECTCSFSDGTPVRIVVENRGC
ncbi:MAG: hypothetical protein WAV32_06180 [Halobacteriota archaeon]